MIRLNYGFDGARLIKSIYQKIQDYQSINPLEFNDIVNSYTINHIEKYSQDAIIDYVDLRFQDFSQIEFAYNLRQKKFFIDFDRNILPDGIHEPYDPQWPVINRYTLNDNYTFKIIGQGINPEYLYQHYEWFHNVMDILFRMNLVLRPEIATEYYFKFNVTGLLNQHVNN